MISLFPTLRERLAPYLPYSSWPTQHDSQMSTHPAPTRNSVCEPPLTSIRCRFFLCWRISSKTIAIGLRQMVNPEKVRLEPFFTTSAACCNVMRLLSLMRPSILLKIVTTEDTGSTEESYYTKN